MNQDDPLDILIPDTQLDKAREGLAICERKLAQQTTDQGRLYYTLCIKGWQRHIEALEAEQDNVATRRCGAGDKHTEGQST